MGSKLIIRQWGQREDRPQLRFYHLYDPYRRAFRLVHFSGSKWFAIHLYFWAFSLRLP